SGRGSQFHESIRLFPAFTLLYKQYSHCICSNNNHLCNLSTRQNQTDEFDKEIGNAPDTME
ncbi:MULTISPECIES: hypothetical protein, partial [Pseudoalteromonas]|uniref:hypothetical protein n=1 Tax=Pseudoalteromonas TaxID=53246 RepID=UPI001BB24F7F